jgi:hypothetical protein
MNFAISNSFTHKIIDSHYEFRDINRLMLDSHYEIRDIDRFTHKTIDIN